MTAQIELKWRENDAMIGNPQWLVIVKDDETGSSTSFEARNWPEGVEQALLWAGFDARVRVGGR